VRRACVAELTRWNLIGWPGFSRKEESRMSDDKTKTGGQDRKRVSLQEDYEVRDWSQKFGVSEDRLRAAVSKVGDIAEDVERELRH